MTDWEVIEQHIQNMEEALVQLRKYQNIPYGAPRASPWSPKTIPTYANGG